MNEQGCLVVILLQVACKPSQKKGQELSNTASLRDLMGGRWPEVIAMQNMTVVSQHPVAAFQWKTGLGIEQDAQVKQ